MQKLRLCCSFPKQNTQEAVEERGKSLTHTLVFDRVISRGNFGCILRARFDDERANELHGVVGDHVVAKVILGGWGNQGWVVSGEGTSLALTFVACVHLCWCFSALASLTYVDNCVIGLLPCSWQGYQGGCPTRDGHPPEVDAGQQ